MADSTSIRQHRPSWGQRLWEPRKGSIEKACEGCKKIMHLPRSKADRRFCSMPCRKSSAITAIAKQCVACGNEFFPRHRRQRFCSQKCNASTGRLSSAENLLLAQQARRAALDEGRISLPSGPENKLWKGGPKALRERQIRSGKAAAWLRRYRQTNPDKVKEFSQRRKGRKLGKLPRGTVPKIRSLQRDKCAICFSALKGHGHIDHIMPLARGGTHTPDNLQILCATCNLTKADKDPIAHLHSMGRLI